MVLPFVRDLFLELQKGRVFRSVQGEVCLRVTGLTDTARLLYVALLAQAAGRPVLFFTANNKQAEAAVDVVQTFYQLIGSPGTGGVVLLPAHDTLPYEGLSPHPDISEKRAIALWKLARGQASIVVAPLAAAAMRLEPPQFYADLGLTIRRADGLEIETLVGHLESVGYARHEPVEMVGQFSVRGGIVDVFSPESPRPVRLELFGDEVESIREFDVSSQRSTGPREEVTLLPLADVSVRRDLLASMAEKLQANGEESYTTPGETFPGWEFLVPLVTPLTGTLFELPARPLVVMEEPHEALAELDHLHQRLAAEAEQAGRYARIRPEQLYLTREEIESQLAATQRIVLEELGLETSAECGMLSAESPDSPHSALRIPQCHEVATQPSTRFHGNIQQCADEVHRLVGQGCRVVFFAATTGDVERLADIFNEYGVTYQLGMRRVSAGADGYLEEKAYMAMPVTSTVILKGVAPRGVVFPEERLAIFGNQDLFDASDLVALPRRPPSQARLSIFLSDFGDLKEGDYVVHLEHGIGRYLGLKEIATGDNGKRGEFMLLEYADETRLYVPLERLDLVQKYRSLEGARPRLDKLGGVTWERAKSRVRKSMRDMAEELLKLYATRKIAAGRSFSPDSAWQREFEDAFEFSETADQLTAINDVKRDMEKPEPMDRLLCGDVGYGKTEVAMRAAFKAVQDGRQVAILAPTTILVFQHFETFRERFAAFPVRVEMLSRFRTRTEQKQVMGDLELGRVDVVVGTHRILSTDVVFKDLGLLVIDEEQRFGVRHKERIKQMREQSNIDVLSMSATPIPRTLHMSLIGLRDMSVIETAPKDRLAIQTVVAPYSDTVIRTAIEQELARNGQVYFLHNRVESIHTMAEKLQELVPKARVAVAHGQMDERSLEKVMLAFVRQEHDVLLSTTIIENGLDIPLCNTILINRADRFGLSELYQLRGRVGRSNRRAYAYLLVPVDRELSPQVRKRLSALKEFSDLGAGFKIAALDLELRGAGNLLGGEQHGHVNAVGFDLYCQLLERAVRELKGEEVAPETETAINLGMDIRIPPEYIPEEAQRLRMYKRLGSLSGPDDRGQLERELLDRYGPPPPAVLNLLEYGSLKAAAGRLRIRSIERKRDAVNVKFDEGAAVDPMRLMEFVTSRPGAQFTPAGVLHLPSGNGASSALLEIKQLLAALA
ncbi:MAG: transcription-repair coupling factor [Acidobacteria bacterium]|nr:transcription-repair coupling factor [Acidobacteriota bacterium]